MGKLAENKIRNRRQILDAGFDVFKDKGLEQSTIADIVLKSGLARGTFYNYFQTKESVWDAIILEFLGEMDERIHKARIKATSAYSLIADAYREYFELLLEKPDRVQFLMRNQTPVRNTVFTGQVLDAIYRQLARDMKASGHFDHVPERILNLSALAMMGVTFEVFIDAARGDKDLNPEELSQDLAAMFVKGLQESSWNP